MKKAIRKSVEKLANRAGRILRKDDPRWLYWSVYHPFNFGDWIGPFLYEKMTGREPWFSEPSNVDRKTVFMSAGSILTATRGNCVVWGSGIRSRDTEFQKPARILAVRGPYTKERCDELGYECPEVYGDPGILLPKYYSPKPIAESYQLGVIPHFRDLEKITEKFNENSNVRVIDVRYPIERIVDEINACELIVSSSLHGIIVSNAYGKRSGWVDFGSHIGGDGIKFLDYYASLDCFDPTCLRDAQNLELDELVLFAKGTSVLSVQQAAKTLQNSCPFPDLKIRA